MGEYRPFSRKRLEHRDCRLPLSRMLRAVPLRPRIRSAPRLRELPPCLDYGNCSLPLSAWPAQLSTAQRLTIFQAALLVIPPCLSTLHSFTLTRLSFVLLRRTIIRYTLLGLSQHYLTVPDASPQIFSTQPQPQQCLASANSALKAGKRSHPYISDATSHSICQVSSTDAQHVEGSVTHVTLLSCDCRHNATGQLSFLRQKSPTQDSRSPPRPSWTPTQLSSHPNAPQYGLRGVDTYSHRYIGNLEGLPRCRRAQVPKSVIACTPAQAISNTERESARAQCSHARRAASRLTTTLPLRR